MSGEAAGEIRVGEVPSRVPSSPVARVRLNLDPAELRVHFGRCGQTANWLSSYLGHDLPAGMRATAVAPLSTVINELIENAVKFSAADCHEIRVAASCFTDFLRLETWNAASGAHARHLERTIADLAAGLAGTLFDARVAANPEPDAPGIGLVIIRRDYGGRLGATLAPRSNGTVEVHVSVEIDMAELARG